MKNKLNITFTNPNTEEQIVQAISSILAYNLAQNKNTITFNYKNITNCSNSKLQAGTIKIATK